MKAPGEGAGDPLGGRLRLVALAMAGSLSLLLPVVLLVGPEGAPGAAAAPLTLGLGGAAIGLIGAGLALAVSAAGAEPGPGRSARLLVSLALREGGGLAGVPLAFLGAGRAWAAALLGLSVVSILALLPSRSPRT